MAKIKKGKSDWIWLTEEERKWSAKQQRGKEIGKKFHAKGKKAGIASKVVSAFGKHIGEPLEKALKQKQSKATNKDYIKQMTVKKNPRSWSNRRHSYALALKKNRKYKSLVRTKGYEAGAQWIAKMVKDWEKSNPKD